MVIVESLMVMLNTTNKVVKSFRMMRDRFQQEDVLELSLRLLAARNTDNRTYSLPVSSDVADHGFPDLFITYTCNPNWDEIKKALLPGDKPEDRPDIVARVFKLKLDALLDDLMKYHHFGKAKAVTYNVEFQKRGLPHVHILLWLENSAQFRNPATIDKYISAEIPDPNLDYIGYDAVTAYMVHGPCGFANPNAPCMEKGIASLLLPGGRTTHSRFKIPLTLDEWSTCEIKRGTHLAILIQQTSLIIWDEAPMIHRNCFEALDRSLRDIMSVIGRNREHRPFGGITMVFGGDFRQILPVVPGGAYLIQEMP
ncbi:DNA helicase PIF1, ATP-dependent [Corchorus olitorius]|uniref:ATP-dependent DNA helicase n=1 Tax=Corchorus olitorius TaxID=93759 RepID=A0A1R3ICS0_9ROSI|nr:DNA helicase PIF1, ATP-dependent [Corchorus olitorius]